MQACLATATKFSNQFVSFMDIMQNQFYSSKYIWWSFSLKLCNGSLGSSEFSICLGRTQFEGRIKIHD